MPSWKSAAELVKKIAENYTLPYYTLSPTYSICRDHGYLVGEQFTCPVCGKPAEVYSRITGYYRPVQNWNDGKAQEFKDRTVYDIGSSTLKRAPKTFGEIVADGCKEGGADGKPMLFTTKTCPNCKMSKMMLDKAGIDYVVIDAEDNKEAALKYGVKKAPTMLVPSRAGFDRYDNASKIKGYIENIKG